MQKRVTWHQVTPGKANPVWFGVATLAVVFAVFAMWWSSRQGSASNPSSLATSTQSTTTPSPSFTPPPVVKRSTDVASVAENLSGASQFASLLKQTGVGASLSTGEQYTLFVPTDAALEAAHGTIVAMSNAELKRFVQYHIVVGRAVNARAQFSGQVQSLSGDMLNFNFGFSTLPLVGSAAITAEYQAENGIVYLIDDALLPPLQ